MENFSERNPVCTGFLNFAKLSPIQKSMIKEAKQNQNIRAVIATILTGPTGGLSGAAYLLFRVFQSREGSNLYLREINNMSDKEIVDDLETINSLIKLFPLGSSNRRAARKRVQEAVQNYTG